MIVAIFCIFDDRIDVGFAGDPLPQSSIALGEPITPLSLHKSLLAGLETLLVSPRAVSAVIVEPPLFSIDNKQCIADILLAHCWVASIGFLHRSVCCLAQHGSGIVLDAKEELAVPVYDYRELTPFIRTTSEFSTETTIDLLMNDLATDIRKPVKANIISSKDFSVHDNAVWQGASALSSCRKVWPLLTRENHKQGSKVWDSLYDMT